MMQPVIDENNKSINKTQLKIKQLKTQLALAEERPGPKKIVSKTVELLSSEYDKLAQLRLDQCNNLKDQWKVYRDGQRQSRKKEIEKRQVEFDEELDILDTKRRKDWTSDENSEQLAVCNRNVICDKLIKILGDYISESGDTQFTNNDINSAEKLDMSNGSIDVLSSIESPVLDNSVVIIPPYLLELFWAVDVEVPVLKSEITTAITQIKSQKRMQRIEEKDSKN